MVGVRVGVALGKTNPVAVGSGVEEARSVAVASMDGIGVQVAGKLRGVGVSLGSETTAGSVGGGNGFKAL